MGKAAALELKGLKVGLKQVSILNHLELRGQASITELAEHATADLSTMSRSLKALEKLGWVKRSLHSEDNRVSVFRLTAKGKRKASEAVAVRDRVGARLASTLNELEAEQFTQLAMKAAAGLQKQHISEEP